MDLHHYLDSDRIIYLGQNSYKKDIRIGVKHIENYNPVVNNADTCRIIDHPSPRNRNFNKPGYEAKMLVDLKRWLYE